MTKSKKNEEIQETIKEAENLLGEIKKVTLESLLNKDVDNSSLEYHSEALGGILEFVRINPEKIQDILSEINQGLSQMKAYQRIIYFSCPLFQNKDLIAKYTPAEPYEVVYPALNKNIAEINEMGNLILKWYGFKTDLKE